MLTLTLVKITNHKDNSTYYHAVNDRHYDAMLASGDMDGFSWEHVGEVMVSEEILNEEGFREYGG